MKILINASTIIKGGGFQVALNVIKLCLNHPKHTYYFLLNQNFSSLDLPNENVLFLEKSPAGMFFNEQKKVALAFEQKIKPDIVYSVGAPSYINFNSIEVLRLTNPWIIGAPKVSYQRYSFIEKIKMKLRVIAQRKFLNNSKYFITQTEDAKAKIVENLNKLSEDVYVIENVYSYNLKQFIKPLGEFYENPFGSKVNVLILTALYPHKNLEVLIDVCKKLLLRKDFSYKFYITIPNDEYLESNFYKAIVENNLEAYFENLGKVAINEIPEVFKKVNIFFLPTLLEVFSVSFLEAMIFERPIITSDFGFNKSVCRDAALYVDNILNEDEIIEKFEILRNDELLRNTLINNGKLLINNYKSNNEIYLEHLKVLEKIYDENI